jgi:hypothetical protein
LALHLLEPPFEKAVGVSAVLPNEKHLLKKQLQMSGSRLGGPRGAAECGCPKDL